MEFFNDLVQYGYLRNAFLAAILSGVACGLVGTYIVSRRRVFLAGGITHASFGGLGLAYWLGRRGKSLGDLFRTPPPPPPHVAAIQALEALHHQKLWQNEKYKQYYSGLTDILRTYIDGRWGVGAMEMTSDEIIMAMRGIELPEKARMDLTTILRDGDLVKFAKATPDAEQNEADYLKAYYFVEETKPATEQAEPNAENE